MASYTAPPQQVDGVTLQSVSGTLSIKAGGVGGTEIAAAIKDPAAGTPGLRTLSTTGTTAAAGNDSRFPSIEEDYISTTIGSDNTWTNWDLSASIPAGAKLAFIGCKNTSAQNHGVRASGSAVARIIGVNVYTEFPVDVSASKTIQVYSGNAATETFYYLGAI